MADSEVREIMSAFAAGCMDKENFIQFKKYLQSDGDLPKKELGELQNIISLVPIILEIERPGLFLKNELAKNLIRLQKQKSKITAEQNRTTSSGSKVTQSPLTAEKTRESFINKEEVKTQGEPKEVTLKPPPRPVKENSERLTIDEPPLIETYKTPLYSKILIGIAFTLALAAIAVTFIWKNDYEKEIAQLKGNMASINAELQVSGKFVSDYRMLIDFLNQPDVAIANLKGTDFNPQGSGKVLFGFGNRQALVEIKNQKQIQMNQTLQLWITGREGVVSLGTINLNPEYKFFEISGISDLNKNSIDSVKITVEPRIGSDRPTGATYLSGTL